MTALSADRVSLRPSDPGTFNGLIVNSSVMYAGARAAICSPTHGTSGSRGYTKPWTGASGEIACGFWGDSKATGDTSATPIVNGRIVARSGIIRHCPVTGLAGDRTDNQKYVYASDDATYTLTRPSAPNQMPHGIVVEFEDSTYAAVYFFSYGELRVMEICGGPIDERCLGVVAPHGTTLMGAWIAPYHGKILSAYALCVRAPTDADVDISAVIKIETVATTGGVMTLLHGDAAGDKKSGTSITAANEFHAGDSITIGATVNTAGTATDVGEYVVIASIERQIGL